MSLPYSICIEVLFAEAGASAAERVRAAAAAGFAAVEMWHWSTKDLDALEDALAETGVRLKGMVCEPLARIVDPASHERWLDGVSASLAVARRLGAEAMIVQSGEVRLGIPREEQREALIGALAAGAERVAGEGVRLLLEPLNTRIDHPGTFLDHTPEALEVVDAVGRREVALLYDIYHSVTMGETPQRVLAGHVANVGHLHLADVPGRHEPGSGGLPWRSILAWLESQGYHGHVGLEYWPTHDTDDSLRTLRESL
ncbi:MAG: TIM barrel protein [Deinococcales bacterium]